MRSAYNGCINLLGALICVFCLLVVIGIIGFLAETIMELF